MPIGFLIFNNFIVACMLRINVFGICKRLKHKSKKSFQYTVGGIDLLIVPFHKTNVQKEFFIG